MRVLISGFNGFVGKHLIQREFTKKYDLFLYGRDDYISEVWNFNPDIVFHLAGEIKDESKMFDSNIVLTYNLLKNSGNATFIYVGSSSEYGRKNKPINEKENLEPTNLYEATKGCGSLLCSAFASTKKRVIVTRPFSLYGINDHRERFFQTIFEKYKKNKEIEIYEGSHDWVYIDDFIDGLLMLMEKGESGDIVNFGTGISTTNLQVIKTFEKVLGKKIRYKENHSFMRNYDSDKWVCDTNYLKNKYNFECKTTLEEGIKQIVSKY